MGTLDFGAGSVVDFGSIATIAGNGFVKNGDGTLVLTGGAYTGGMTLNAGNVIARGANAFGTGALTINGGKIASTAAFTAPSRTGGSILVGGDFQIGIADSPASSTANMTFSTPGNGLNLNAGTRRITLGSSGSMTFGQVISNGGLTLARNAAGAAGSFSLRGNNTFADGLTLDNVSVNVSGFGTAIGTGRVTLTGDSATALNLNQQLTFANNFTIADSAGTKTITNSGGNATINGTISNNDSTGGFVIGAGSGRIFTIGAIDGSGSKAVTFGGGSLVGIVVITGAGTYTGNTVIDGSTVRLSGANASVSAANLVFKQTAGSTVPTFDLNGQTQTVAGLDDSAVAGIIRTTLSGGKLIVGDSNNSTFRGTIASANSLQLEKVGTGKLTLTGANTYTAGTKITAGELEVSSQSLKGDVNNDSRLTFNQTVSGTFAGSITGTGSLTKNGTDALTLTGGNSYSGGTTVSAGDLIGSTDALQGNIVNDATVTFRQAADGIYAGDMSGTGALVKTGVANVTLTGANTYGGGTTISAGGLTASTGSLPTNGNVVADAGTTLTFDQNTDGSFGGILSGAGALVKAGSGAVTLSGANTYSGGTTVTAGSLVGTTSSLRGAITNNAAVTFDQATGGTYSGVMSGTGALTKLGSGSVTLTGANTYTGATLVSAGKLLVNGSLADSAVTVGNGGTLGGSGTLGGPVTVQSGGVLSPGDGPGQLFLSACTLQGGSTTLMEVIGSGSAAGTAGTDYDQIQITTSGGLTYGGSLDLAFGNSTKFLNGTVFDLFAFSGVAIGDFSTVFTTGTGLYAGKNLSGAGGIWTTTIGDQLLTFSELSGRLTFTSSGGAVPEIDPAMGASALSLVAGVLAMLEQRRRKRAEASAAA